MVVRYIAPCLLGSLTNGKATPGCVTTRLQGCANIFGVNVATSNSKMSYPITNPNRNPNPNHS